MIPAVAFPNNHKLAHAVDEHLEGTPHAPKLSLRPFNRFSTAFTNWWLIPSHAEWPAYQHSKLCFFMMHQQPQDAPSVLAGFYVEKGLDPSLKGMAEVKLSHIMSRDWYWHAFVDTVPREAFSTTVREAISASHGPIDIVLDSFAFNKVPEPDTLAGSPSDTAIFRLQAPDLALEPVCDPSGELACCAESPTLGHLIASLHESSDLRFFWLYLRIGVQLAFQRQELPAWTPEDVWRNALLAWVPWVH